MEPAGVDVDELIEFWTLLDEDRVLLAGRRGATALGFAVLLKYYSCHGRFPRGRSDTADDVVAFVAGQLGGGASDLGFYEWTGRTIEYHRAQIRNYLGYRVATVSDQDELTVGSRNLSLMPSAELTGSATSCWASSAGCVSSRRHRAGCCGWSARLYGRPSRTGRRGLPDVWTKRRRTVFSTWSRWAMTIPAAPMMSLDRCLP